MTTHRRRLLWVAGVLLALPIGAHLLAASCARFEPPAVTLENLSVRDEATGIRRAGDGYTRVRGGVREVYLRGSPEHIGQTHAVLLRPQMTQNEGVVWGTFQHFVPLSPVRTLLMDIGRVQFRHVDQGFPDARRREVAAEAAAFQPDPYAGHMPTYPRMVFLHALYDIALSFEHSPLLGCSSFGLTGEATADGHTLLARAFDFEVGDVFDRDKAVFLVAPDGAIPFASVAWPGLVGVMSGMNAEGVAAVVHGGRAGEPSSQGEPVLFTVRDVLERAHDTNEATAILASQPVMVPHIVFVGDAAGRFAVVERAPGHPAFVRPASTDPTRAGVTNHFEGPLAGDPKNQRVRERTTTLPRRARVDELLAELPAHAGTPARAVDMLRDHTCARSEGATPCELGDRRTIDALIATHGVVADTTARVLWVSAGPHLSGRFVGFDLRRAFAPGHDPAGDPEPETIAEDPILHDARYERGRARAGGPRMGGDR